MTLHADAESAYFAADDPDPHEVCWYYTAGPSVSPPVLDLPRRQELVRFCDNDSLHLELEYRKNARHYSTAWWQQHRAAYEQLSDRSAQRDAAACEERIVQAELDPAGPIVRAGYLEADLEKRTLTPVYWPGAMRTLLRATWFVEMDRAKPLVPLPHPIAATLERHFRNRSFDPTRARSNPAAPQFRPVKGPSARWAAHIELDGLLKRSHYALWFSRTEMYLRTSDSLAQIKNMFRADSYGLRLFRGLPRSETADKELSSGAADQDSFENRSARSAVRHVVLAVHGIGQRLGGRTIADDAQDVRRRVNDMIRDHMPADLDGGFVQVLPVQWRKNLDLDADKVAELIMPDGAKQYRQLAHSTFVEVLLYMSPKHAQYIVDSVATNLNSTYLRFIRRNPRYAGRMSVLAYSLGSVLCYDLLAHQAIPEEHAVARQLQRLVQKHAEDVRRSKAQSAAAEDAEAEAEDTPPQGENVMTAADEEAPSVASPTKADGSRSLQRIASKGSRMLGRVFGSVAHRAQASADVAASTLAVAERGGSSDAAAERIATEGDPLGGQSEVQALFQGASQQSSQAEGRGDKRSWRVSMPSPFGRHKRRTTSSAVPDAGGEADRVPLAHQPLASTRGGEAAAGDLGDEPHVAATPQDAAEPGADPSGARSRSSGDWLDVAGEGQPLGEGAESSEGGAGPAPMHAQCSNDAASPAAPQAEPRRDAQREQLERRAAELRAELAAVQEQLGGSSAYAEHAGMPPTDMEPAAVDPGDSGDALRKASAMIRREPPTGETSLAQSLEHAAHELTPEKTSAGARPDAGSAFADGPERVDSTFEEAGGVSAENARPAGRGSETAGSSGRGSVEEARVKLTRKLWPTAALNSLERAADEPIQSRAVHYPELYFEVDQFITIGSPVGLFCALRGINPAKGRPLGSPAAGAMYPGCAPGGLPVCKRMYNVFHPYDPVACRIEPLIFGKESRRPQLVPYHRGSGYKLRAGLDATGESVTRTFAGVGTAVTSAFTFRFRRGGDDAVQAAVAQLDPAQQSLFPQILGFPALPGEAEEAQAEAPVASTSTSDAQQASDGSLRQPSSALGGRRLNSKLGMSRSCEALASLMPDLTSCEEDDVGTMFDTNMVMGTPRIAVDVPSHPLPSLEPFPASPAEAGAGLQRTQSARAPQGVRRQRRATIGEGAAGVQAAYVAEMGPDAVGRSGQLAAGSQTGGKAQKASVGRCDFQLQEDLGELEMLGVLRSHFCYWKHEDVALLIARAVCGYDVVDGGKVQAVP